MNDYECKPMPTAYVKAVRQVLRDLKERDLAARRLLEKARVYRRNDCPLTWGEAEIALLAYVAADRRLYNDKRRAKRIARRS